MAVARFLFEGLVEVLLDNFLGAGDVYAVRTGIVGNNALLVV